MAGDQKAGLPRQWAGRKNTRQVGARREQTPKRTGARGSVPVSGEIGKTKAGILRRAGEIRAKPSPPPWAHPIVGRRSWCSLPIGGSIGLNDTLWDPLAVGAQMRNESRNNSDNNNNNNNEKATRNKTTPMVNRGPKFGIKRPACRNDPWPKSIDSRFTRRANRTETAPAQRRNPRRSVLGGTRAREHAHTLACRVRGLPVLPRGRPKVAGKQW
ncbi:hypothetical protein ZHAS_00017690 [Anopheles sinensis]|uniref:Uncharacterized protein n=1 Tax=Anopheles sinensis TaxID=74873 RepID=A0A084WGZ5_ANOSI|nr:hypothetical protein ZHAS_00017690 [Anopheles sinensis]